MATVSREEFESNPVYHRPISDLELCTRITNALYLNERVSWNDVSPLPQNSTIGDLIQFTEDDLKSRKFKYLARHSAMIIKDALTTKGKEWGVTLQLGTQVVGEYNCSMWVGVNNNASSSLQSAELGNALLKIYQEAGYETVRQGPMPTRVEREITKRLNLAQQVIELSRK